MLDLQCFSSRNYERRNGEEYNSVSRMLNSAGYSKIKETIYMVPIPEVAYYLPGEMKNVSCLCSKAVGVYRTIYSSLIRDQLRQAAIHWAKEPALPSLDRSPSWRKLLLQLVADIPNTGCLGMQNLIVVRLYLFVVRNWLSTVTLGTLGIKLFPGPRVTNSGIIAGYQYLLLEMLWRRLALLLTSSSERIYVYSYVYCSWSYGKECSCLAQVLDFMSRNFCQWLRKIHQVVNTFYWRVLWRGAKQSQRGQSSDMLLR